MVLNTEFAICSILFLPRGRINKSRNSSPPLRQTVCCVGCNRLRVLQLRIFGNGARDCIVETAIEGAKFVDRDRRSDLNGETRHAITQVIK